MPEIINGNEIARVIREEIRKETAVMREITGVTPGLAVVLVGEDPASRIYVRRKGQACAEVGFLSREIRLPAATSEGELLDVITQLNGDPAIHGVLVQLPLPRQIGTQMIIEAIAPAKDVDGFHPVNVGRLMAGNPGPVSCTPRGVMELLDRTGIAIAGREAVIVGDRKSVV